jgi:hypothetical protein
MATGGERSEPNESPEDWGSVEDSKRLGSSPAYLGDRHFYRVAIWALSSLAVLALVGSIVLFALHKDVPEAVVAVGSTAVGALAGVLMVNRR